MRKFAQRFACVNESHDARHINIPHSLPGITHMEPFEAVNVFLSSFFSFASHQTQYALKIGWWMSAFSFTSPSYFFAPCILRVQMGIENKRKMRNNRNEEKVPTRHKIASILSVFFLTLSLRDDTELLSVWLTD